MQEFTYRLLEDGTFAVMGYRGDEEHVVIPADRNITVIYDCLFRDHKEIRSVSIPDTVTDLGEFVFDGLTGMSHLKLPRDLVHLWGKTFIRCGLEEIVLPEHVTTIPPFAFKDCIRLKKVVLNDSLLRVQAWAFAGCVNIREFIHGSSTWISPEAFMSKELNQG